MIRGIICGGADPGNRVVYSSFTVVGKSTKMFASFDDDNDGIVSRNATAQVVGNSAWESLTYFSAFGPMAMCLNYLYWLTGQGSVSITIPNDVFDYIDSDGDGYITEVDVENAYDGTYDDALDLMTQYVELYDTFNLYWGSSTVDPQYAISSGSSGTILGPFSWNGGGGGGDVVTWYKDGVEFTGTVDSVITTGVHQTQITFNNAAAGDAGIYYITVYDPVTASSIESLEIQVIIT